MKTTYSIYLEMFKAMGDDIRLSIVEILSSQKLCACELQEILDRPLAQPSLSYHLKVLTDAGILTTAREGKWIRFAVDAERMKKLQSFLGTLIPQDYKEESEAINKCKF